MSLRKEPMHSDEVMKELYLDPLDMGKSCLGMPRLRMKRLIKGTTGIAPSTALRLARAFKRTPAY